MNIAIIPARSGSKGVLDKNIFKLWDIPLIGWAAIAASKSEIFDSIILSTDSSDYARIGLEYGCEVPFLRPADLAADTANINDVILHLIENSRGSEAWENIALIEPTCPLRTPSMIKKCYSHLNPGEFDSAISVSPIPKKYHPAKQLVLEDSKLHFYEPNAKNIVNRQQLRTTYFRSGVGYFFTQKSFRQHHNIFGEKNNPVIFKEYLINIDDQNDIDRLINFQEKNERPSWF